MCPFCFMLIYYIQPGSPPVWSGPGLHPLILLPSDTQENLASNGWHYGWALGLEASLVISHAFLSTLHPFLQPELCLLIPSWIPEFFHVLSPANLFPAHQDITYSVPTSAANGTQPDSDFSLCLTPQNCSISNVSRSFFQRLTQDLPTRVNYTCNKSYGRVNSLHCGVCLKLFLVTKMDLAHREAFSIWEKKLNLFSALQ